MAVELLIGHRYWLFREDFLAGFVWTGRAGVGRAWPAVVDWLAAIEALDAGRLVCPPPEALVLRIAAGIAMGTAVDLRTCLSVLDGDAVAVMAAALLHAPGRHAAAGGGERG